MPPLAILALATPAAAQETLSPQQAETRLRGCLQAGAAGAPRTGLREAVIAVRALCTPQIERVRANRVAAATQGLTEEDAARAEKRATRELNDEIARAIANFTGLRTL
ncbi:hypothetical protein AAG612_10175 [Citromicrobium bathyomarinum]|uniref:hypothetical protein n=1 Tax=Citromicrobium bathyomarinum TaxID=72174 RepID=UPI003159B223